MARTPHPPAFRCGASPGFTLGEALIAIAIIAAMITVAIPSFTKLLDHQRAAASIHAIAAQFAIARSTAITRRIPVSVCPSRGDGTCRNDWDWSEGWLMYLDPERKGQPMQTADILRNERSPAAGSVSILSSSGRRAIRFQPNGRTSGSNITVKICRNGRLLGKVVINNAGRVRSERTPGDHDCHR